MYYRSTIVGWVPSDFTTPDGKEISGFKVWCLRDLNAPTDGDGQVAFDGYITSGKLNGGHPEVGDTAVFERYSYKGKTKYRFVSFPTVASAY